MYSVTVVLLDDGYASTALIPIEIFHSAGVLWRELRGETPAPAFDVTTVTIDGKFVRSPYAGLTMAPARRLDEVTKTDILIVPTPGLMFDQKVSEKSALLPWLRRHYDNGAYVAGVCGGAAYLAEAGILDGRRATTHWALADDFAGRYPRVDWQTDMFVTEDCRALCSGGITAAADVCLYLVEKLCGHETALQTAKSLLLNMPRTHQCGYAMLPLSRPHDDDAVRKAERILQQRFAEDLSMEDLAHDLGMSARTFVRRFKEATGKLPGAYQQTVRVETAKTLLERERSSVQAVACAVGYDDVSFFRAVFKRVAGMTPASYRERFARIDVRAAPPEPLPN